jgi:hypothetical protein
MMKVRELQGDEEMDWHLTAIWRKLALPIAVGAFLRLFVILINPHIIIWDEVSFDALATRLVQGGAYGLPFWPPGWPGLIAILYFLTEPNPQVVLRFNLLISVATLIIFGLICYRLIGLPVAVIGTWIMALMPSYLLANTLLVYEVWMQFLLAIVLLLALTKKWSWGRVVMLAIITAMLTLIRPTWLLLPIVLGFSNYLYTLKRPALAKLIVFQLGIVLLISPWILYASNIADRFVPIAMQGGLHLWMANNPEATGTHLDPPAEYWNPENDALARQTALDYLAENPWHPLKILPAKVWYSFRGEAWADWFIEETDPPLSEPVTDIIRALSNVSYFIILALSIGGIIWLLRKRAFPSLAPLLLFGYSLAATLLLFTGQLKYRWPLQFILILYAALSLSLMAGWLRSERNRPVGSSLTDMKTTF